MTRWRYKIMTPTEQDKYMADKVSDIKENLHEVLTELEAEL